MWRDIGLNDWLFNLDAEDEVARIPSTVLAIAQDPVAARAKAGSARAFVQRLQHKEMEALATSLR
jgi:hypothetical protein